MKYVANVLRVFSIWCLSIGITQAAMVTYSYEYDALNRLIRMSDTCGNEITYAYDDAGNLTNRSVSKDPEIAGICESSGQYVSLTLPSDVWMQLGLPESSAGSKVVDVFGAVLPDEQYGNTWVLYEYTGRVYRQLQLNDSMSYGSGLWFMQSTGESQDVRVSIGNHADVFTGSVDCLDQTDCFTTDFALASSSTTQWTMLSNPLTNSVSVSSIFFGSVAGTSTFSTAISEVISAFSHSGGIYVYRGSSGAYEYLKAGLLEPWEAGWVSISVPGGQNSAERLYTGFFVSDGK